jgi:hypothetical protein
MSVSVSGALGTTASLASVTVPVNDPVRICAGAELIAASARKTKRKADSRPVKKLLLELTLCFINFTPNKIAISGIVIDYSRIAPASSGYRSNFIKILTAGNEFALI